MSGWLNGWLNRLIFDAASGAIRAATISEAQVQSLVSSVAARIEERVTGHDVIEDIWQGGKDGLLAVETKLKEKAASEAGVAGAIVAPFLDELFRKVNDDLKSALKPAIYDALMSGEIAKLVEDFILSEQESVKELIIAALKAKLIGE